MGVIHIKGKWISYKPNDTAKDVLNKASLPSSASLINSRNNRPLDSYRPIGEQVRDGDALGVYPSYGKW